MNVAVPDLTVTKTNSVSGSAAAGTPWTWTLTVSNSNAVGTVPARFDGGGRDRPGQPPEREHQLRHADVANQYRHLWAGNIVCAIVASDLTCTASGGRSASRGAAASR